MQAGRVMDEKTLAAYRPRMGVPRPATVDAATLRTVHRAHQMTVPFENLSIHLSEPISLDSGALLDKIVTRRRGGFCYELNGAFALLLQALGADVTRVAARVHGDAGYGPPFDHLALVVRPPTEAVPGWLTSGSALTAAIPCSSTARRNRTIPPPRSRLPPPP